MGYTSPAVKQRYNKKVYTQISAYLPKDFAAAFKAYCKDHEVSQASVIKAALAAYTEHNV